MNAALRQRVSTALVLAAILLVILFALPPMATSLLIAAAILGGAWEWSAFLNTDRRRWRMIYVALVGVGLLFAWQWSATPSGLVQVLVFSALWWLVALGWILVAPNRGGSISAALSGLCALIPTGIALARVREAGATPLEGAGWLLFVVLVVMAADVAAYFAGHRFGRTKLAPEVSPGKTWEGVFGGVLASSTLGAASALWLGWPVFGIAVLAAGAAAFSVVGDLTESLVKRHCGLKDSGHLFPGHGGVLDRLDSLTAGVPLFVLGLLQAGVIGVDR